MALLRRFSKWLLIAIAIVGVGYVLIIAGWAWLKNYLSEGFVRAEPPQGNVLVALSYDQPVRQALLSSCSSTEERPAATFALMSSGLLAEIPSGTKMHILYFGGNIATMIIAEGKLKGRQVWVCPGRFGLMHAMP
jgi:hypothetical protein